MTVADVPRRVGMLGLLPLGFVLVGLAGCVLPETAPLTVRNGPVPPVRPTRFLSLDDALPDASPRPGPVLARPERILPSAAPLAFRLRPAIPPDAP